MPKQQRSVRPDESSVGALETLAQQAIAVAKKARRNHQNLAGDNHYGNKLAALRADAANHFRELSRQSVGDTTALAELIDVVFSPATLAVRRLSATRDLVFSLRTTWRQSQVLPPGEEGVFPLAILAQTRRGYLVTVGRQMNGCYAQGWCDACAVMMRRLIEIAIIEAFENHEVADHIKDKDGNYFQLSDLIAKTLAETELRLSRNAKKYLPKLRDLGHMSAHGRYFHAQKDDIEKVQQGFRVTVEELLYHADLLS